MNKKPTKKLLGLIILVLLIGIGVFIGLTLTSKKSNTSVAVTFTNKQGKTQKASLNCDQKPVVSTGFLKEEKAASLCKTIKRLGASFGVQKEPDRICAQVFVGPERAHVTGRINGREVDVRFTRSNACEANDWDKVPLFPPLQDEVKILGNE